jgi:hypothetical protein
MIKYVYRPSARLGQPGAGIESGCPAMSNWLTVAQVRSGISETSGGFWRQFMTAEAKWNKAGRSLARGRGITESSPQTQSLLRAFDRNLGDFVILKIGGRQWAAGSADV